MINCHKLIRKNLYEKCGIIDSKTNKSIEELRVSEWSKEFEELMRNRLIVGAIRYGEMYQKDKFINFIKSIRDRLNAYEETGNTEFLVDIANLSMLEFVSGFHPLKHFKQTDDIIHCIEG